MSKQQNQKSISRQGVGEAAGILMIGNLFSKVLGYGRELVVAFAFGAGASVDAYVVAYLIPGLLATVFGQTLIKVFIPIFTHYRVQEGEKEAWKYASTTINLLILILAVGVLVPLIGADLIVPLIGHGFEPATQEIAVNLMRIMSVTVLLSGIIGIFNAILNSYEHFIFPAFGGVAQNACIILGIVLFAQFCGIRAEAYGLVIGMLCSAGLQLIPMMKQRGNYSFILDLRHPGIKKTFAMLVPIMIGSAAWYFNITVDRMLASGLAEGSVSALNYANILVQMPMVIFGTTIGAAIYPAMSQYAAKGEMDHLRRLFSSSIRQVAFITIPASIGLMVLNKPIIQMLFQRGAFDAMATEKTSIALKFYVLGLFANAALGVVTNAFYAFGDSKTPVKVGVFAVLANVVLNVTLVQFMGLGGLALATSLATLFNFLVVLWHLKKRIQKIDGRKIFLSIGKCLAASGVMGLVCWILNLALLDVISSSAIRVGVCITSGVLVYGGISILFKFEELGKIVHVLDRKMPWLKLRKLTGFAIEAK